MTTPPSPVSSLDNNLSFGNGATFNQATGQAVNQQAVSDVFDLKNPNGVPGVPISASYTSYVPPGGSLPVSTTTLSSDNKKGQVLDIQKTTDQYSQKGSSYDANGNILHSNGTITPAPPEDAPLTPTSNLGKTGVSQGGYYNDVYYAPGSPLPTGPDGKAVTTTPTSPTDDTILKSLNDQLTQSDTNTASIIQSIQQQYSQLIDQQKQVNTGQESSVNNALNMGGVTGQGSSAQFAPISSSGIIQAQVSYGIQQISQLQAKEDNAILQAKIAGQNQKFDIQNNINNQISKIRDEKVNAAIKLNDTISAQNKKIADDKLQQTKDTAISNLVSSGVSDPAEILKTLSGQGLVINASEVATALKNIDPGKAAIQTIATDAAKAGAPAETVKAILSSNDPSVALQLATPAMGAAAQATLNSKLFTPPTTKQLAGAQFYKYPNSSVVYTSKGQPISLDQYKQLTNQTGENVDFSAIKTISPTPTGTASKAPKLADDVKSMAEQISTVAGEDGYMSPDDYKKAKDAWVNKGGHSAASFDTNFKNKINPADSKDYK